MKTITKVLLFIGSPLLILIFLLIIPVVVLGESWWWFFAPLIFFSFVGIVIGIVLLIMKLKKPMTTESKIDVKDAKRIVINEIKYDEDNPDNFRVNKIGIKKVGEKGSERTPVAIFDGFGTELNQRRVAIVNLNNPKKEIVHLPDPTKEEVDHYARMIADNPPEEAIQEETTIKPFGMGQYMQTTRVTRPSSATTKAEQEKKEVEESNAI